MSEEYSKIVLDPSSSKIHGGYASELKPSITILNCIGRPKFSRSYSVSGDTSDCVYGDDAEAKHSVMAITYPVTSAGVAIWSDYELIVQNMMEKNFGNPDSYSFNMMCTENSAVSKSSREKSAELIMDVLSANAFFLASKSSLTLRQYNLNSGVVIHIGWNGMAVCPIFYDIPICHATKTSSLAASILFDRFLQLIQGRDDVERNLKLKGKGNKALKITDIARVSLNYSEESLLPIDRQERKTIVLSDGSTFEIGNESIDTGEILFTPNIWSPSLGSGVADLVYESVIACDPDIQEDLWRGLVLSGSTTAISGFVPRLQRELEALLGNPLINITISSSDARNQLGFIGGSMFAAEMSDSMWVTQADFAEDGPSIVHRRCLM